MVKNLIQQNEQRYKNIILLGDFKVCVDDEAMENF